MQKIKILRIIARLNIGGPAVHTILLTEGLNKSEFESALVYGSIGKDEGDMSYYATQRNTKTIFIPELKREINFRDDIIAFKKIYNIIKTEQPHIIHTHTAKAGALGRLAAILYNYSRPFQKRIILIHTFHGHIFDGYFNKIQTLLFILAEQALAFFTDKIITVSSSVKKQLTAFHICKEPKIDIVPLGLELDNLLKIPFKDKEVLNIAIVGRLVPIKNHRLFLEAAAKIITDNPQTGLRFKIIGDGELKKDLQDYAHQLNIDSRVDFLGWQKELTSVYSESDLIALTSINEGTPVSLIETMASARPVVATDVGGVRDLLGNEMRLFLNNGFKVLERGVIVKSQDAISFAGALLFLLQNNTLRKEMVIRARNFVSNKFTKERLIKDMEGLYKNIFTENCLVS